MGIFILDFVRCSTIFPMVNDEDSMLGTSLIYLQPRYDL